MTDWTLAGCSGDPDAMYSTEPADVAYNRRVCGHCPIRQACLQRALDLGEEHGMWGGLTPRQRRRLAGRANRFRPELVEAAAAGTSRLGALNRAEQAAVYRRHVAAGGTNNAFAARHGMSGTSMRKIREAAAQPTPTQFALAA